MKIKVKDEKYIGLNQEQIDLINNVKKIVIEEEKEKSVDEKIWDLIKEQQKGLILLSDQVKLLKDFVDLQDKRIDLLELEINK